VSFAHYRRGVGIRTSRNSPLFAFDLTAWNELRGRAGTENCRAPTPPARQDGSDRRREVAAHADGLAARRAPGLRHDSATKPERRGPPSDVALARDAAARAHSAHGLAGRTPVLSRIGCPHSSQGRRFSRNAAMPSGKSGLAGVSCLQAVDDRFLSIGLSGRVNREDRKPPGEAVRGPSSSSTALNPEPTAQTDPLPTFSTSPRSSAKCHKDCKKCPINLPLDPSISGGGLCVGAISPALPLMSPIFPCMRRLCRTSPWTRGNKPALSRIDPVVFVHRLREVMAHRHYSIRARPL
jgi:hypothetical protein